MKTYYCPLCGEELKLYAPFPQESIAMPTCLKCGYQILNDSALRYGSRTTEKLGPNDYQVVESFLSKFSPFSTLRVGSKIKTGYAVGVIRGITIRKYRLPIYVEYPEYGDEGEWIGLEEIEKWPWEMETEK